MAERKRSRRRFLTDLVWLGGGTLAASLLMYNVSGGTEKKGSLPFSDFPQIRKMENYWGNAETFAGKTVVDYTSGAIPQPDKVFRIRSNWDGDKFEPAIQDFLSSEASLQAPALVIGAWFNEDPSQTSAVAVSALVKNKDRLPQMRALYLGDIVGEESEMSWIQQSDVSPLLEAFPDLEVLRIRGGAGLAISKPAHKNLRALAIESGGLDKSVVQSISQSDFPNLEYLELWLGTENYGGNVTIEDLGAIFSGRLFPKLRYLGLRNFDKVDTVIPALVANPMVQRIEELDLSLGILTDVGGKSLMELRASKLQRLNLYHHYLSPGIATGLEESLKTFDLDLSNPKHMDTNPEDRYVAVGE